jgi:hypothetical protein
MESTINPPLSRNSWQVLLVVSLCCANADPLHGPKELSGRLSDKIDCCNHAAEEREKNGTAYGVGAVGAIRYSPGEVPLPSGDPLRHDNERAAGISRLLFKGTTYGQKRWRFVTARFGHDECACADR